MDDVDEAVAAEPSPPIFPNRGDFAVLWRFCCASEQGSKWPYTRNGVRRATFSSRPIDLLQWSSRSGHRKTSAILLDVATERAAGITAVGGSETITWDRSKIQNAN